MMHPALTKVMTLASTAAEGNLPGSAMFMGRNAVDV